MNLKTNAGHLTEAFYKAKKAVSKDPSFEILENAWLRAQDGELSVVATSLEKTVAVRISAEVAKEGSTTISVKSLHDLLRKIPDSNEIQLKTTPRHWTTVKSGSIESRISGQDPDNFPQIDLGNPEVSFELNAAKLKYVLSRTSYCTIDDYSRPELTGVSLEIRDDMLVTRASDSYRIATSKVPIDEIAPDGIKDWFGEQIIPADSIKSLNLFLDDSEGATVHVTRRKNNGVSFSQDNWNLSCQVVDGSFPDLSSAIPTDFESEVTVERTELVDAISVVELFAEPKSNKILYEVQKDGIKLTGKDQQRGTTEQSLDTKVEGDTVTIGVNAKYLKEVVKNLEGDTIRIFTIGEKYPMLLRTEEDDRTRIIVVPMRA